jgi:hypothetical protein
MHVTCVSGYVKEHIDDFLKASIENHHGAIKAAFTFIKVPSVIFGICELRKFTEIVRMYSRQVFIVAGKRLERISL